jgi:hypothetical protein
MSPIGKATLAALMSASAIMLIAPKASAEIVCNGAGDCWHAQHGDYPDHPKFGLVVHPDAWKWDNKDKHRWHEHAGRGYWDGDTWKTF